MKRVYRNTVRARLERGALAAALVFWPVLLGGEAVSAAPPGYVLSPRASVPPAPAGLVFVSWVGSNSGKVSIYDEADLRAPIGEITNGIGTPAGLAVDGAGDVYVVNSNWSGGPRNVVEYAPPYGGPPIATYADPRMQAPFYVTVRKNGTVWVTDQAGGLFEFKPGRSNAASYRDLSNVGQDPTSPQGLAFNASGDLYVQMLFADYGAGGVIEIQSGTGSLTWLSLAEWDPDGIAFDRHDDMLLEDNCQNCGASLPGIHVFAAPAYTSNTSNITPALFDWPYAPSALALDRNSDVVFVANHDLEGEHGKAYAFTYPAGNLIEKTSPTGRWNSVGIAVAPAARI